MQLTAVGEVVWVFMLGAEAANRQPAALAGLLL
jgi:hypothetical protein